MGRGSLSGLRSFGYPTRARRPGCKKETVSRLSVMNAGQRTFCVGALCESNRPRDYILGFDPLVSLLRRRCRHRHGPPTIPPDFMGARPTYWRRPRMAPALIFLRCMSFGSCFVRPRFGNKPHITGDSGRGFLANYAETHTHDLHYPAPPSVLCSLGSAIQPGRYTGQTLSTKTT